MNTLTIEIKDSLAIISLSRPGCLNSVNMEMLKELQLQFEQLRFNESITGVLLTGAGGHFA